MAFEPNDGYPAENFDSVPEIVVPLPDVPLGLSAEVFGLPRSRRVADIRLGKLR